MALGFKTGEIRRFITAEDEDGPQRFEIGLDEPSSTDVSDSESSTGEIPSLELPDGARQSVRTEEDAGYRAETGLITVEQALAQFGPLLPNRLRQSARGPIRAVEPRA